MAGSRWVRATAWLAACASVTALAQPAKHRKNEPPARQGSAASQPKVGASIDALSGDVDFAAVATRLREDWRAAVEACDPARPGDLRDAALGARLATQLAKVEPATRTRLVASLAKRKAGAMQLAFLLDLQRDDAPAAWALFDRLGAERGAKADRLDAFVAALCVVRDTPLTRTINENTATPSDPLAVFDYFERNEARMVFSLSDTPPELLTYVADTTASPDEMTWAFGRYAGCGDVGSKFFDIAYDLDHFSRGAPKRVTQEGFSLSNIFQFGGVCADQAYFASTVGKAVGVPAAYVVGASSEGRHAWVGFLGGAQRSARWDFDSGRYDEFRNNLGVVENPQTDERIADSELGLLAELLTVKDDARHKAVALADAARVVIDALPPVTSKGAGANADPQVDRALALLEASLRTNAACVPSWGLLRRLASEDRLTLAHKRTWAEAVRRFSGGKYPDFALDILTPMVQTIDDPKEQARIWNALFMDFGERADLGARIRLAEARMWEKSGDTPKALAAHREVIDRYAIIGPSAVTALAESGRLLFAQGKQDQALALMESTWKRLPRPDGATIFAMSSNWARTGMVFAAALADAGKIDQANRVFADLGIKK